jgi:hypothetical protein
MLSYLLFFKFPKNLKKNSFQILSPKKPVRKNPKPKSDKLGRGSCGTPPQLSIFGLFRKYPYTIWLILILRASWGIFERQNMA